MGEPIKCPAKAREPTKSSIWFKAPGKRKNMSSGDEFLLKPTRENKKLFLSKWRKCPARTKELIVPPGRALNFPSSGHPAQWCCAGRRYSRLLRCCFPAGASVSKRGSTPMNEWRGGMMDLFSHLLHSGYSCFGVLGCKMACKSHGTAGKGGDA